MKRKLLTKNGLWVGLSGRATLIAFVLFVLLAGGNSVAVRFSDLELPPFWGAASRFGLAALIFWAIVLVRRTRLPRGRALVGSLLYGVVGVGVSFALVYWALVHAQAGMASIFLAFVPLPTVFLAAAHGVEPLKWRRVVGALVSTGGITLIVSGGLSAGLALPVLLVLMLFPFAMAEGAVIVKLFPKADPAAANAVGLSVGALILAGLSLLSSEQWSLPAALNTWVAFGYLVVIGTLLVFYLWLFVLARWPASRTAYGFVLMPLVGITISVLLTGEVITAPFVLGAVIMLAGVWLGAISRSSREAAPRLAPAPEVAPCTDMAESAVDC
jgi:drug/metabolite transporter (DMT)-like permease